MVNTELALTGPDSALVTFPSPDYIRSKCPIYGPPQTQAQSAQISHLKSHITTSTVFSKSPPITLSAVSPKLRHGSPQLFKRSEPRFLLLWKQIEPMDDVPIDGCPPGLCLSAFPKVPQPFLIYQCPCNVVGKPGSIVSRCSPFLCLDVGIARGFSPSFELPCLFGPA